MTRDELMTKVTDALDAKHLNFNAKMAETYAMVDGVYVPTGWYTPVRDDKTDRSSIITGRSFSGQYHPIQHADAFEVIGDMVDFADVEFKNIGSWGNGAGVYAQVSIGSSMDIGSSGDKVGRWLSVVNSHDGSRALQILVTPFRFFCSNQISKAITEARHNNRIISIYHSQTGQQKLRAVASAISDAELEFEKSEEVYRRLADRVIDMDEAREAMARCYPIPVYNGETPEVSRVHWERRVVKLIERFNRADDGHLERMTGWNLYNAIQGLYQHSAKRTSTYEKSLIMGGIAHQAETSLRTVQGILFDGDKEHVFHPEFDRLFKMYA